MQQRSWSLVAVLATVACAPEGSIGGDPEVIEVEQSALLTGTATASSSQGTGLEAAKAVDGSATTRWSSQFSDPQWLRVDFGTAQAIDRVVLKWEAAYGKAYQLQVSNDGTTWTTVRTVAAGDGGTDDLTGLAANGRYLRMYGTARATAYGYSLWDISAYAPVVTPPPPPPATAVALPARLEAERPMRSFDTTTGNSGDASCSSTNVDAQVTTDSAGGTCNIGWVVAGEWLEWDVSVATAGAFDFTARMSSNTTGKSLHVELDGANVTGTLTAPSTGWQAFADVTARNISVAAGAHKLRIALDTGSTNVNYLDVKVASTTPPPPPPTTAGCKRGDAYGFHSASDLTALSKRMTWWYNWALAPDSGAKSVYQGLGVEFVPMVWGQNFLANAASSIPQGAKTLLTFNEPNFFSQSNLSPAQAAALWPQVQQIAGARGLKIASPALNYCGGGCWETNPFTYMDKFFAACTNCQVDYIAVHWYACSLSALQNYINGWKKYGKPIWLTEFACGDGDTALANQKAYMQAAIPYLENEPTVMRYAWFSGRTTAIPNVNLLGADGKLTELGQLYDSLTTNAACGK